jgi:predicted regulator of Ras-like GTPase activity (Roadblock/LC7/MglB family)
MQAGQIKPASKFVKVPQYLKMRTYGRLFGIGTLSNEANRSDGDGMTRTRTELMVSRLREMQAASPEIEASAVVSVDGLIMASALPAEVEEDRVSAMSAAMLSLGERISTELGRGSLEQVYIRGNGGYVILSAVGEEAVLTVLAREGAKLGLIFLEMRRAAEHLARVVG